MRQGFLLCALFIPFQAFLQSHNVFFIGHSLVNERMPKMMSDIAIDLGVTGHQFDYQYILGSPLKYNWQNPGGGFGTSYETALQSGNHDVLIMTEAVPLTNHLTWSGTYEYAQNFHDLAQQHQPEIQTYIYETWHCINSGTPEGCSYDDEDDVPWRDRLSADVVRWQGIADSLNRSNTGKTVYMIPAGQGMAALYDSIQNGSLSGVTVLEDLYTDDIHLNDTGNYFVACIMYATVYKQSPEGATRFTTNEWGGQYDAPSEELALQLQQIAWEVVCQYPYSGVDCTPNGEEHVLLNTKVFQRGNTLQIQAKESLEVTLYDLSGKNVFFSNTANLQLELTNLPIGMYFLHLRSKTGASQVRKIALSN